MRVFRFDNSRQIPACANLADMSADNNVSLPLKENPDGEAIATRYVGFCDILGFSARILTDFDGTLDIYKNFGGLLSEFNFKEVEVTMYSDAVLVTGNALNHVASAIQGLWFFALANDF